jgi:dTMP kinase
LRRGSLIVIEGIDKSGKTTQSELLTKILAAKGIDCIRINFPDYSTPIGTEIKAFLHGKHNYPDEVKMMLLSANRWEKKNELVTWLKEGKVIVMNRYYQSNLVYGISKGLKLDWLKQLDKGMPKENLVIVIDIDPITSSKRSKSADLFESDFQLLRTVKKNYLAMARRYRWVVVNGEKSREDLKGEIMSIVNKYIKF